MKVKEGQRVTLSAAQGWNSLVIRGGSTLDLVAVGPQTGTVIDTGKNLALVELDRGITVLIDRQRDPRVKLATAQPRDLTVEEANQFRSDLLLALGTDARVDAVLRVFIKNGLGIFKVDPNGN